MTPEQEAAILEDVACGLSVVKAAESRGVHRMQFYRAMDVDAALRDKYARAKEVGLDAWADEVKEIADNVVPDAAEVAKARLQVDSRKWLLSKLAPKKYGDKLDLEHSGHVGLTVTRADESVL